MTADTGVRPTRTPELRISNPTLRCVIVDPDRDERAWLAGLMGDLGAQVAAVATPLAARASCAHNPPALVIAGPTVDDDDYAGLERDYASHARGCAVVRVRDDSRPGGPRAYPRRHAAAGLTAWCDAHAALTGSVMARRQIADAVFAVPEPVFVVDFTPGQDPDSARLVSVNAGAADLMGLTPAAAIGARLGAIPRRDDLHELISACCEAHRDNTRRDVEVVVDGRHLACRAMPWRSCVAVTTVDVSGPRRDSARRDALSKVADAVARATPLLPLCRLVCDLVADRLDVRMASIGRCSGDETRSICVNDGAPMDMTGGSGAASAMAAAARSGSPVRTVFGAGARTGWPTPQSVEEVAVPIMVEGEVWGSIMVARALGEVIVPDAEAFLESMAHMVAIAIGHESHRQELLIHARTDTLTGLPNRRAFEDRLDEEMARVRRHGRPMTLAIVDVDHFKRVNDTFGHGVGDDVLQEVALRLARVARVGDLVARLGGEEFAWLMPDTDVARGFVAVERAREGIAGRDFPTAGSITASVGLCDSTAAPTRDMLFHHADAALYRAKHGGRNRSEAHRATPPATEEGGDDDADVRARRRADVCAMVARSLGWGETRARELGAAVDAVERRVDAARDADDAHLVWGALAHHGWDRGLGAAADPAAVLSVVRVWDAPSAGTARERRMRLEAGAAGLDDEIVAALRRLDDAGRLATVTPEIARETSLRSPTAPGR